MKKNISINISGIIFHIEEDGYESLRKYLDSINKYFAAFEDSKEILSDIESRIAEIFLSKLNEGKQIITLDDVNSLMVTMGSVTDFKAAEETATESEPIISSSSQKSKEDTSSKAKSSKKLFRDGKRKILGGVCAGLGHYFNIDPVWTRVIFALLVLGSYGVFLALYIILWIALPESSELDDMPAIKKMYRDQEKKVIGGVASGLAAFAGIDVVIIRLLFVITAFFGFGIVVYIIFWIALPEAKTITEKMEMQGEPVTLSNIESSVKKSLNEKDDQEESTLAKIILFPFRAIAAILNGIAKILGPVFTVLVDVMRIGVGAIITLIGFVSIIFLIFIYAFALGLVSASHFPEYWNLSWMPVEAFQNTIPTWTVAFSLMAMLIPALVIFLLGVSAIAKRLVYSSTVGWTLFGLFFLSIIFLAFSIPQIVLSFKENGETKTEQIFTPVGKITRFKIAEKGMEDYQNFYLNLKSHEGNEIKVVKRFEARGRSRKDAAENSQMVEYNVEQKDSTVWFDSNITFKKDAKFRGQKLRMEVFVPKNTPFEIEDRLWRMISNIPSQRFDNETHTWKFIGNELECITCEEPLQKEENESSNESEEISLNKLSLNDQYGLSGFNALDLSGIMKVTIQQGDEYAVDLGSDNKLKERYEVYLDAETLVISFDDNRKFFWNNKFWGDADEIQIKITMPSLVDLNVTGAGKVSFKGFNETEMEIDLTGAVQAEGEVNVDNFDIEITGASSLDLKGNGNSIEASITGASSLRAYGYEVEIAVVEAHGASTAKVNVTSTLEMSSGVASSVSYRGNPEVVRKRR
jgi:phage shock protein PspC (stress-responsive transcriptional regulator)